jgi:hypothetical protein
MHCVYPYFKLYHTKLHYRMSLRVRGIFMRNTSSVLCYTIKSNNGDSWQSVYSVDLFGLCYGAPPKYKELLTDDTRPFAEYLARWSLCRGQSIMLLHLFLYIHTLSSTIYKLRSFRLILGYAISNELMQLNNEFMSFQQYFNCSG